MSDEGGVTPCGPSCIDMRPDPMLVVLRAGLISALKMVMHGLTAVFVEMLTGVFVEMLTGVPISVMTAVVIALEAVLYAKDARDGV